MGKAACRGGKGAKRRAQACRGIAYDLATHRRGIEVQRVHPPTRWWGGIAGLRPASLKNADAERRLCAFAKRRQSGWRAYAYAELAAVAPGAPPPPSPPRARARGGRGTGRVCCTLSVTRTASHACAPSSLLWPATSALRAGADEARRYSKQDTTAAARRRHRRGSIWEFGRHADPRVFGRSCFASAWQAPPRLRR